MKECKNDYGYDVDFARAKGANEKGFTKEHIEFTKMCACKKDMCNQSATLHRSPTFCISFFILISYYLMS